MKCLPENTNARACDPNEKSKHVSNCCGADIMRGDGEGVLDSCYCCSCKKSCHGLKQIEKPELSKEDKEFYLRVAQFQSDQMDIMLARYNCAYYSKKELKVLDSRQIRHTVDLSEYILLSKDDTTIEKRYKPEDLIIRKGRETPDAGNWFNAIENLLSRPGSFTKTIQIPKTPKE